MLKSRPVGEPPPGIIQRKNLKIRYPTIIQLPPVNHQIIKSPNYLYRIVDLSIRRFKHTYFGVNLTLMENLNNSFPVCLKPRSENIMYIQTCLSH